MDKEIKKTIREVLRDAVEILRVREEKDVLELKSLSNKVIQCTSIHQDLDTMQLSVLIYSFYKIFDRKVTIQQKKYDEIFTHFEEALEGIKKGELQSYNAAIEKLFQIVKSLDVGSRKYLQKVLEKASINKGSGLFAHGLSSKRSAEIMGISEWQLLNYIGMRSVPDDEQPGLSAKKRLKKAEELFA